MDRGKSTVPSLVRSSSVAESTSTRSVSTKYWKPTPEQKQILEAIFASGTRNPSPERIAEITAELQRYGRVEGKNIFYWFQNAHARDKRKKEQSQTSHSKWPTMFRSSNWTSLFRSKKTADKESAEEEEEANSGFRRNSSVDISELKTLDLFPRHPARGDF